MTDRFQTLKAEWDRRLEEDGFNDIEREDGSLRKDKSKWLLKHNPVLAEKRFDYYTEAERALVEHIFDSTEDRAIWTHHARGSTVREVAEMVGVPKSVVGRRLTKYRARFGLVWPG